MMLTKPLNYMKNVGKRLSGNVCSVFLCAFFDFLYPDGGNHTSAFIRNTVAIRVDATFPAVVIARSNATRQSRHIHGAGLLRLTARNDGDGNRRAFRAVVECSGARWRMHLDCRVASLLAMTRAGAAALCARGGGGGSHVALCVAR
jgi:hypothetical protein